MVLLVAVLGAACTYDEAQSWRECCALRIADDKSSSTERDTLIAWGGAIGFHGDGTSKDWDGTKAWRKQKIALGLAGFQEAHPASQARDYLADLGMACASADNAKAELTRCAVELPVWVTCTVKLSWPFLSTPVPKELRRPIAAVLQMTIDVSTSDILDSSVQVVPFPGGRLCQR